MESITHDELNRLMKGLAEESKAGFARRCGASPNAALAWFKKREIPVFRLVAVAHALKRDAEKQFGDMNPAQSSARQLLEHKLGQTFESIVANTGINSSAPPDLAASASNLSGRSLDKHGTGHAEDLTKLSTEALVDALQKKGWIVTLSRTRSPGPER